MTISLFILLLIFLIIAIRKLLPNAVHIWHVFFLGVIAVLIFRQISLYEAFEAIDWNIIFFLWGMLILSLAFEHSGIFDWCALKLFSSKKMNSKKFLFFVVFGLGLASIFFYE